MLRGKVNNRGLCSVLGNIVQLYHVKFFYLKYATLALVLIPEAEAVTSCYFRMLILQTLAASVCPATTMTSLFWVVLELPLTPAHFPIITDNCSTQNKTKLKKDEAQQTLSNAIEIKFVQQQTFPFWM